MNNSERGLYISLLCLQWNQGAVSQVDIDRMATLSFSGDVSIVTGKFKVGKDGLFRNERMEIERSKQVKYRESCSNSGKSGAYKRWGRHSHPITTDSHAIVSPLAKNSSPSPSPIAERESNFTENNGRPTLAEVQSKAQFIGLAEWKVTDWFDEMQGCGWLDHNQRRIVDWQAVLTRVCRKWESDGRPMSPPKPKDYGNNRSKTDRPNPRNFGIVRGPTDYATAKPRRQRELEEEETRLAGQVAPVKDNPPTTSGG